MSQVTLPELGYFTGSLNKYQHNGIHYTDGVHYVMEKDAMWLVTDIMARLKCDRALNGYDFLVINFVPSTTITDRYNVKRSVNAYVEYKNDNGNVLIKQEYNFTYLVVPVNFFFFDEEGHKLLILRSEY